MKVAIIGSGVSGLAAAYTLAKSGIEVIVYEKDGHVGGHACTVPVEDGVPVDVGFMVFNRVTYPNMVAFFEELGVEMEPSQMSFSVSLDDGRGCEWGSDGLQGLFAQKRNLLNLYFFRMLREMILFQSDVLRYLDALERGDKELDPNETLGTFLKRHGYSSKFQDCYLVPVCGSIWSCGNEDVLAFSAASVLSFLRNHHMLQITGRPQWLTVKGRSSTYVSKVVKFVTSAGGQFRTSCAATSIEPSADGSEVEVRDANGGAETFDHCVLCGHAPDALALLGKRATPEETEILGAFHYSESQIFLHRDKRMMPKRKAAWSAWNFRGSVKGQVCVSYWLNALQNLGDTGAPVLVTLNPEVTPQNVVREWRTSHPIPSPGAAIAARQLARTQGQRRLWFCGAYLGYGFHEDGFKAGVAAAKGIMGQIFTVLPYEVPLNFSWAQLASRAAVLTFLRSFLQQGHLIVHESGGTVLEFGTSPLDKAKQPRCLLRIRDPAFYWKVATRADLGLADAYVDGDFTCQGGSNGLLAFLLLLISNRDRARKPGQMPKKSKGWWRPYMLTAVASSAQLYLRHLLRRNSLTNARRNISNHYDLSNDLFALFLDSSMTYSCAIFKEPNEALQDAQMRKLQLLIAKAKVEPHHHVLEIGFGWGSLALELVRSTGCSYTGITLSKEQLRLAQARVNAAGLQDKIEFKLCDYRQLAGLGKYDRIISCEMLEAVGHEFFGDFFHHCDRLLALEGLLVVQVITTPQERYEEYRQSSDFIKEYIFPGCCVPAFTALTAAMASSSSFCVEAVENIGPHYAPTLLRWRDNFLAHASDVERMGFGPKFVRMWDYYFVYCAAGFKSCTLGDLQIVFTRPGNTSNLGLLFAS